MEGRAAAVRVGGRDWCDGAVWAVEVIGDQVWVGGTFNNVLNHSSVGGGDIYSRNLAIINLNTGHINPDITSISTARS